MVRLTDRPDMTLNVYQGHKTTIQQQWVHTKFVIVTKKLVVGRFCDFLFVSEKPCLSKMGSTLAPMAHGKGRCKRKLAKLLIGKVYPFTLKKPLMDIYHSEDAGIRY